MTHLCPARTVRAASPTLTRVRSPLPPLSGNRTALRDAVTAKRAQMAALEAAWVAAAETDIARHLGHGVRADDRSTWDRATSSRYLAAAEAHEPDFKPRIRRLLTEIDNLERLLASPEPGSNAA